MRARGDIVLVSTYELGHQPLAIASPLAFLRRAGFDPVALDLAVAPLDGAALETAARARLCAVSVPMHTATRLGLQVIARVRAAAPSTHLCAFGLYAPLHAAALRRAGIDTILGPEGEEALVELATALAEGRPPPPVPARLRRLAYLAPARDGLPPLDRYARLVVPAAAEDEATVPPGRHHPAAEHRLAGAIEATRGCRHLCRHCPIPVAYDGRFFAVPVDVVVADAAAQIEAGARHLTFTDPDFFNAPKHALAVARALHERHPGVTFDVTIKVEHLLRHRAHLPELARLGCLFVVSAVESLSDRVLEILDKGHAAADVVEAIEVTRAAGLSLRPTFLPFTPWTTLDDYLALCQLVRDHELEHEVDPVQLSLRLLVPPGSLLLELPELGPHLVALDEEALTWRWTHPDPRMDELQLQVAALVEASVDDGVPAPVTFARIHDLAARAAGRPPPPRPESRPRRRAPAAHLSEPWFC